MRLHVFPSVIQFIIENLLYSLRDVAKQERLSYVAYLLTLTERYPYFLSDLRKTPGHVENIREAEDRFTIRTNIQIIHWPPLVPF